ncbi:cupredoxin domain-containing protein [Halapricum hydrolyticum]|uniref:Plastocyanin/azurin family copper-binding protein n=1 Tax=Halapricum hydrolyticum TaxID=2979991 RepID=A0AAE3IB26_9EURY|nr:plastocyanin/azurin family copper-binding protein [Halapricum hydrolyticum]MCU4717604.1 plastocyanin/azurin family copper-binding protein [Halapricum hydrolyticum]MCU4726867.1 plastocyanin/azurin family copper-binding protein [Halapricum hydrolyticum]
MKRRTFLATGAATLAGGCLGLGAGESDYDVGMTSMSFEPETLTVPVGTTVVWQNTNSRAHTVTAYAGRIPDGAEYFATGGFDGETAAREQWFESGGGNIYGGETFSYTVEVAGTYEYFCIPHESGGMVGAIEVTE